MAKLSTRIEGPLHVVYDVESGVTVKECATAREAALFEATEKAGNVGDLAKHLLKKYGDEHLFTACMGDETTAEYDHEARAAVCARVHHEATGKWPTEKEMKEAGEMDETTEKASTEPGDYLIVEDREKPTTWHLQVRKNGKPDHGLMGGAWAALHEGYRGNKYEGPNKQEAIGKLRKMYDAEDMPVPGEEKKEHDPSLLARVVSLFTTDKEGRRHSSIDQDAIQQIHDLSTKAGADCPMMVMKDAKGKARWVLVSTNAYEDRDGEYVARKAQKADVARMNESKQYGPLRLWHLGYPDVERKEAGPGVDIGDCDYSQMFGKFRIESGTFRNERVAAAIKERADKWATSVGFFHPQNEPDPNGVYHEIYTFERSLLPRTKASNYLTPLAAILKELNDMTTKEEKVKGLTELLGDEKLAQDVLGQVDKMEKDAAARGLTYKQATEKAVRVCPNCGADVPSGEKKCPDCGADLTMSKAKKEAAMKDKDGDDDEEDDISDMDEGSQKAYKAMLPHILKAVHTLTKKSNIMGPSKKELKAAKKERKAQRKAVKELTEQIAELKGELPRGLAGGAYRPSQTGENIFTLDGTVLKEKASDPLGDFMKNMGMATGDPTQPNGQK